MFASSASDASPPADDIMLSRPRPSALDFFTWISAVAEYRRLVKMQKSAAKVKQTVIVVVMNARRRLSIASKPWMVSSLSRLLASSLLLIGRLLFSLAEWLAHYASDPLT